jgi:hypothetical protein
MSEAEARWLSEAEATEMNEAEARWLSEAEATEMNEAEARWLSEVEAKNNEFLRRTKDLPIALSAVRWYRASFLAKIRINYLEIINY